MTWNLKNSKNYIRIIFIVVSCVNSKLNFLPYIGLTTNVNHKLWRVLLWNQLKLRIKLRLAWIKKGPLSVPFFDIVINGQMHAPLETVGNCNTRGHQHEIATLCIKIPSTICPKWIPHSFGFLYARPHNCRN